jgi:hypothetical protein
VPRQKSNGTVSIQDSVTRRAEVRGLNVMGSRALRRMKIYRSQEHIPLTGVAIDVLPELGTTWSVRAASRWTGSMREIG